MQLIRLCSTGTNFCNFKHRIQYTQLLNGTILTKIITIDGTPYCEVPLKLIEKQLARLARDHCDHDSDGDEHINASTGFALHRKLEQTQCFDAAKLLLIPEDCLNDQPEAARAWLRHFDILTPAMQEYLRVRLATEKTISARSKLLDQSQPSPRRLERRIATTLRNTDIGYFWLGVQTQLKPQFLFTQAAREVSGTYYVPRTIHHRHSLNADINEIVKLRIHELTHLLQYNNFTQLFFPDLKPADNFVAMKLLEASAYAEEVYYSARKMEEWSGGIVATTDSAQSVHQRAFMRTLNAPFMDSYEAECLDIKIHDLIGNGQMEHEVSDSPFLTDSFLTRFCRPFAEEDSWYQKELREAIICRILDFQHPLLRDLAISAKPPEHRPPGFRIHQTRLAA